MNIFDDVKALARARAEYEKAKTLYHARLEELTKDDTLRNLKLANDLAEAFMRDCEEDLRSNALEMFGVNHAKKNIGYQIKIVKSVKIPNVEQALKYCIANMTGALKLDETKFKKAAKENLLPFDALSLVEILDEPTVYIDSDLSEYLKEGKE